MSNPRLLAIHHTLAGLGAAALCAAWLVPFHYAPWSSFYNELCAGIGLVFLAGALIPLRQPYEIPGVAWMLFAVPIIPWVQWTFGIVTFSGDAWISTLYLFGFASAVAVGFQSQQSPDNRLTVLVAAATLIAACVSSAIGIDQFLSGSSVGLGGQNAGMTAQGNLGQANNLATLIGMGAVGLLLLRERNLLNPVISGVLLILLVVGAGLTRSRTALLYGPAILVILMTIARRNSAIKTKGSIVVGAIALHFVVAFGAPLLQKSLTTVVSASTLADRGLESSRFKAWPMFIDALNAAPLTGYGWLETAEAQFSVATTSPPVGELYYQAHNIVIDFLVWCGYPLGIVLTLLCAYWVVSRTLSLLRTAESSNADSLCAYTIIVILGLHSLVEFPHHYAYFLIPAGLWIGVIERSIRSKPLGRSGMSWVTAAVSVILLILVARDYLLVQTDFDRARIAFEQGNTSSVRSVGPTPFMSELEAYTQFLRTTPAVGMSQTDLDALRNAAKRYPTVYNLTTCSLTLAVNGKADEARSVLLRIPSLHGQRRFEPIKRYLHALIEQQKGTPLAPGLQALEASLPP